jgi:glycerophosphoryl diester phosphodiesterase
VLIIGHRTCPRYAAENSLAGLAAAATHRCDGVEIDLRVSLDGQPFLMHDNTMRRTVGLRWPLELTPSAILRRLMVKANGLPIPTLGLTFAALPQGLLLAVDVKTPWAAASLLRAVKAQRLESRVLIWCTSARALRWVTKRAPDIECAYLKTALGERAKEKFIARAVALGARAISAHWLAIDSEFVAKAHARSLKVYSFHEDYPLTPEKLASGLDGLITDDPEEAREALAAMPA